MIEAPPRKGFEYDILYEKFIKDLAKNMKDMDDDFLVMYIGATGTGKTSLALHGMEVYLGSRRAGDVGVDLVGLTRESFADALKKASEMQHPRVTLFDEANISKRDSLTKFNRDLLDLFFSLRGLNILHMWCNPSLDMIDKSFIKEKIRGVFFIPGKHPHVRRYYFFRRNDLLGILEKYGRLDLDILGRVKGTAYFSGWFKPYKGVMWKKYLQKKNERMLGKVDSFFEKYGSRNVEFKPMDARKALNLSQTALKARFKRAVSAGLLVEGKHFEYSSAGYLKFMQNYFKEVLEILEKDVTRDKRGRKNK